MARILMIDDDQTVLDLEKKYLSDEGHEVLMTDEALTALDFLELYAVDLIIVDIQMPRLNGFQFVTTIKNNPDLSHIPIAFLSSSNEPDSVEKAAKLGADFYLVKPIIRDSFLEKIRTFFSKNPPRQHPRIEFQNPCPSEIKLHQLIQVISISELGVEVIFSQELVEDQIIELSSELFQGLFEENPILKVLWTKSTDDGEKRAYLSFEDRNVETVRKIQRHVQSKALPAAVLKYPKWR